MAISLKVVIAAGGHFIVDFMADYEETKIGG